MNDEVKGLVNDYLFNDDMKAKIIKALNDNIDIPFISEKTEGKIINSLYETVEDVIKAAIKKAL